MPSQYRELLPVALRGQVLGRARRFARDFLTSYDSEACKVTTASQMEGGWFSKCGSRLSAAQSRLKTC
eukprot:2585836-Pyramimonas_sp.AAC.1